VLVSRPIGIPTEDNFRLVEVEEPKEPISGVLLKTLWLSLDPYSPRRPMAALGQREKSGDFHAVSVVHLLADELLKRAVQMPWVKPGRAAGGLARGAFCWAFAASRLWKKGGSFRAVPPVPTAPPS